VVHVNPHRKEERRKGRPPTKIIHRAYDLVQINLQREEER
jgi:hypothetical protein